MLAAEPPSWPAWMREKKRDNDTERFGSRGLKVEKIRSD